MVSILRVLRKYFVSAWIARRPMMMQGLAKLGAVMLAEVAAAWRWTKAIEVGHSKDARIGWKQDKASLRGIARVSKDFR